MRCEPGSRPSEPELVDTVVARSLGEGEGVRRQLPDGYQLDDDPSRLDHDAIVDFLSTQAYWHRWRSRGDIVSQLRSAWRWLLHTADAHGLYRKLGFAAPPESLLERPGSARGADSPAEFSLLP